MPRFFLNTNNDTSFIAPIVYMCDDISTYSAFHNDHEDTWMYVDVPLDNLEQHVREGLMVEIFDYAENKHHFDDYEFTTFVED